MSTQNSPIASLSTRPALMFLALFGFLLGIFGTYWDDAWHTEEGRDSFFIAPHLVLYAGITLAGGALSLWALRAVRQTSWRRVLAHPPLMAALVGVGITFVAAPADNAWHVAFGRDAVIWSPPHMLGVAGSLAIAAGLLLELAPASRAGGWPRAAALVAASAVLAVCVIPVLEYETDVPQYDLVFYLPVLATGAAFAFGLSRLALPGAWAATSTAFVYAAVIGLLMLLMLAMGMPGPLFPLLLAPAAALDLTARRLRLVGTALIFVLTLFLVYVPYLNWLRSDLFLNFEDVVLGLPLAFLGSTAALWLTSRNSQRRRLIAGAAVALLLPTSSALGHDPGQGEELATAEVRAVASERLATIAVEPNLAADCSALEPTATVARRAGQTIRAPLQTVAPCRFQGRLELPERGRWFLYAEFTKGEESVETWLPVDADSQEPVFEAARALYVPPVVDDSPVKLAAGVVIYTVFAGAVLALPVLYRRRYA